MMYIFIVGIFIIVIALLLVGLYFSLSAGMKRKEKTKIRIYVEGKRVGYHMIISQ